LKFISAQLLHEADASALLVLIEQHPCPFICNDTQGEVELIVAVTPKRVENISRRALRMNANYRRGTVDIAQNQGQRSLHAFFPWFMFGMHAFEGQQAEVCPMGWETYISDLFYFHQLGINP
jgi:hypothetical protein